MKILIKTLFIVAMLGFSSMSMAQHDYRENRHDYRENRHDYREHNDRRDYRRDYNYENMYYRSIPYVIMYNTTFYMTHMQIPVYCYDGYNDNRYVCGYTWVTR